MHKKTLFILIMGIKFREKPPLGQEINSPGKEVDAHVCNFVLLRHFISFTLPIHSVLTFSTLSFECRPFIQLLPFMMQMQEPICSISEMCEDFYRQKFYALNLTTGILTSRNHDRLYRMMENNKNRTTPGHMIRFNFGIFFPLKILNFLANHNVVLQD